MTEENFLSGLTIVVDSREQYPYLFESHKTIVQGLPIGDYGLLNFSDIAIERKSVDDLIGSLTKGRDRFEKELQKGSQIPYFALVIEASLSDLASGQYRSNVLPKSIVQSLLSWSVKYNTRVFFAGSREFSERVTLSLLLKYGRMVYQKYQILNKN
jgi:ERCC4-type nuclease